MADIVRTKPEADREPIRLPGSPFWNVFVSFGRDEMIAFIVSVAGTFALTWFTDWPLALAAAGPLIEKIGLFPAHFWEAYVLCKATPRKERESLSAYFKKAVKGGSVSFGLDVAFHDPLYIALFLVLSFYSVLPIWAIAIFSFIAAVIMVAWIKVGITEIGYARLKRTLRKAGFESDSYLEARFFVRSGRMHGEIIERLKTTFEMRVIGKLKYEDVYFKNDLPRFSGRTPVVRLRRRVFGADKEKWKHLSRMFATGHLQTIQIVYTRPQEERPERVDQFRFFSVRKEKFYVPINETEMPASPRELRNVAIRRVLRAGDEYRRVSFERTLMRDPADLLLAAIDSATEDGCVIELKVRREGRALFLAAMRFVMMEFPVTHTTVSKTELGLF